MGDEDAVTEGPQPPEQPTLIEDIDKDISRLEEQVAALRVVRNLVAVNPQIQEFNRMMLDYNSKFNKSLY